MSEKALYVAGIAALVALCIGVIAATHEMIPQKRAEAREALANQAPQMTITRLERNAWSWNCGKEDTFAFDFEGVDQNNHHMRGTVCSGWFKGSTVRWT